MKSPRKPDNLPEENAMIYPKSILVGIAAFAVSVIADYLLQLHRDAVHRSRLFTPEDHRNGFGDAPGRLYSI